MWRCRTMTEFILAALLAAVDVGSGTAETSRGSQVAEAVAPGGAVTGRTVGEHVGSVHLRAVGHFDEDNSLDTAFFRHTRDGAYELVVRLSTRPRLFVLAELRSIDNVGVKTVAPGAYRTVCAKGYGGFDCDAQDAEIRLDRDGVLLFQYESWSQLHYFRDRTFLLAYLSG